MSRKTGTSGKFGAPRNLAARPSNGHPFRRGLPDGITGPLPRFEPEVLAAMERAERTKQGLPLLGNASPSDQDGRRPFRALLKKPAIKQFLLAYCACLLAIILFIA